LAKLEASDTVVLGISIDSPAANAAFAKQIGVTFPLLSDMNKEVLTSYQILKPYDVKGGKYQWAQRTTIVVTSREKSSTSNRATAPWIPIAPSPSALDCISRKRSQKRGLHAKMKGRVRAPPSLLH